MTDQVPWGSVVRGGLAGSALTLITQSIKQRLLRPRLEVLFNDQERGCCVDTNSIGETEIAARYVRLKIKNSGRSTALGVSVCVTELTFTAPGAGAQEFGEHVLDLKLSLQIEPILSFRLAPGAHRFVDLAHTNRADQTNHYDFHIHPARLTLLGFGTRPGTYDRNIRER
jgi:hypothetical protein